MFVVLGVLLFLLFSRLCLFVVLVLFCVYICVVGWLLCCLLFVRLCCVFDCYLFCCDYGYFVDVCFVLIVGCCYSSWLLFVVGCAVCGWFCGLGLFAFILLFIYLLWLRCGVLFVYLLRWFCLFTYLFWVVGLVYCDLLLDCFRLIDCVRFALVLFMFSYGVICWFVFVGVTVWFAGCFVCWLVWVCFDLVVLALTCFVYLFALFVWLFRWCLLVSFVIFYFVRYAWFVFGRVRFRLFVYCFCFVWAMLCLWLLVWCWLIVLCYLIFICVCNLCLELVCLFSLCLTWWSRRLCLLTLLLALCLVVA